MAKIWAALAAALLAACGSIATTPTDAGAPADGGEDAGTDGSSDDAAFGVDATGDVLQQPDTACADAGVASDAGARFACGAATCAVDTEYCGIISAGFAPFFSPQRGCQPLPCACAPTPSCACLGELPGGCVCDAASGGVTVRCALP